MFCQHICHLTGFYAHLCVKIIPLDHFYANIDDIISNFEYWEEKMVYNSIFGGARKWGLNCDLWIFLVLWTRALLGLQIDSLGRYLGCFDIPFVSELPGWCGERTWKIHKEYQKFGIFKIHVTRLVCGKIAPQHYVSSHSGLDLLCHVVNLELVLCCGIKKKMRFGKKNRYLVKSLYFGPNPLVNEVILRFSAFRSYFFV